MNTYRFNFLLEPTTAPVVGDANALERLCRQIGYLWGAGRCNIDWDVRAGIDTGAFVVNSAAAAPLACMKIDTPYRLPGPLEPPFPTGLATGEIITAGAAINAVWTAMDDACGTMLPSLDKPVVTRNCKVVAYLPAGVDVSDEMSTQITIPVCNGQRIVLGTATQTALDGVYIPFQSAWAYAAIGGEALEMFVVSNASGITDKTPRRQ